MPKVAVKKVSKSEQKPPRNFQQFQLIFLSILLAAATFTIGMLWSRVQMYEKGGTPATQQTTTAQPQKPTVSIDKIKALFTDKNLAFGDKNSKNLIVEVGDPSCPYCHVAGGLNPELNKQIGPQFLLVADGGTYVAPVPEIKKLVDSGKAAFVWIYTRGHGNGDMGTKALFCANEKGKFWEVNDKLMTNDGYNLINNVVRNDKTKSQELADFLSGAFDSNEMKACLDSGKYDTRLTDNIATATALGITGTPGFYINTTLFAGAYSWKDMESAVK